MRNNSTKETIRKILNITIKIAVAITILYAMWFLLLYSEPKITIEQLSQSEILVKADRKNSPDYRVTIYETNNWQNFNEFIPAYTEGTVVKGLKQNTTYTAEFFYWDRREVARFPHSIIFKLNSESNNIIILSTQRTR